MDLNFRIIISHPKAREGFLQGRDQLPDAYHVGPPDRTFYDPEISKRVKVQVAPLDHIYFIALYESPQSCGLIL